MTFPYHDPNWMEAADFVHANVKVGEKILAPDIFWWMFDKVFRYLNTFRNPRENYQFAIIHKGEIAHIEPEALRHIMDRGHCVFANPVFVIWSSRRDLFSVPLHSDHLQSFHHRRHDLTQEELTAGKARVTSDRTILPDPGTIMKFETLDTKAFIAAMNAFWQNGGYEYATLRDQTYYAEIDRHILEFGPHHSNGRILDLACGIGRLPEGIVDTNLIIGVDISEAAVLKASRIHRSGSYAVMDAERLGFPDASFSAVLFIDAIEHVKDSAAALAEIARVLEPGGELVVTAANRNSLHLVFARKLGIPEFRTNYQHIREFTLDEIRNLLAEQGLIIKASKGIFLYPFWGIPLLDDAVRNITDDDVEIVQLMRLLGELIGPEHAYAFTVRAAKDVIPR
jgi:SAM-dependent methyltransferase